MLTKISEFPNYLNGKKDFHFVKNNYYFYVPENFHILDDGHIINRLKISKIVLIDHYIQPNEIDSSYFIICFFNVVLTIKESSLPCLQELFSFKPDLLICYLSDSKDIFCKHIKNEYKEIKNDDIFKEEISNFIRRYTESPETDGSINKIIKIIGPSFFGSFIKEAYIKSNNYERFANYTGFNKPTLHCLDKMKYVTLRTLGTGSSFQVDLVYDLILRELFALKKPINNGQNKLIDREIENYLNLYHQLLPRFYGVIINENNCKNILIEFINGHTLMDIEKLNLNEDQKVCIIFELLMTLNYVHNKNYVLRDLKPNNIIIDCNKHAVIIDLDRAVKVEKDEVNVEKNVSGIGSNFSAPEIDSSNLLSGESANKCDIYSFGKIMFWIFEKQIPSNNNNNDFIKNPMIQAIYDICTIDDPLKRPFIAKLYLTFYAFYEKEINNYVCPMQFAFICQEVYNISVSIRKQYGQSPLDVLKNHGFNTNPKYIIDKYIQYLIQLKTNPSNTYYQLAMIDYQGRFGHQNIDKAIFNFQKAASYNNSNALYLLGVIYKNKKNDINTAFHYFQQASKLDNMLAHFNIGQLYYEGKLIKKDIKKAHYYFSLAERKNCVEALVYLGLIYLNGDEIKRNIPKAIEYFMRAANQNDESALINLGYIFYNDVYVKCDVNKSIYYFTEAAKQNNARALLCLGIIYFNGKYIDRDINKAIEYYKKAAFLNDPFAQLNLGNLFYNGKYINKDINQAINYYMLAADSKNKDALIMLSFIYLEGRYVDYDIQKVIYYLQQASIDYGEKFNKNSLSFAQFMLASLYLRGTLVELNINKGLSYLIKSSLNGSDEATFMLAYYYHEGSLINCNIQKAIELYKNLSSFNNQYAKNNLGIIYKNGFNSIDQNINNAIFYFNEAIQQKKDCVSMYNLAHIYFYNEAYQNKIDVVINLLIDSSNLDFSYANDLLCLALIKKYGFNLNNIKKALINQPNRLLNDVLKVMKFYHLNNNYNYNCVYEQYKDIDFLYDYSLNKIISKELKRKKVVQNNGDTPSQFYEGFGFDLLK